MLKNTVAIVALLCSFVTPLSSSYASDAKPVPKPGPSVINLFSPAGGAMPKGALGLAISYVHADKDKVWVNGDDYKAKNKNTFNFLALKPRFGLGNGWDIRMSIPVYIDNDFTTRSSKSGFGDSMFILRKQLFSQQKGAPISFAMGLGIQIPTGSTNYDGVGTGAWGLMPEIGITYAFDGGRQIIEGGANYIWRGDGEAENASGLTIDDIDQNDALRIFARYVYALNKRWDLGIEGQYEAVFESKVGDVGRNDSRAIILAGPAVTFKIPEWKANIGMTAQFALYNDFEAATDKGVGPAAESFRFEMKLTKAF